ncbi:MAG: hypothetical protein ABJB40_07750 [Acidobacteriota bacterium]
MIKKRYIFIPLAVLMIGVLVIGAIAGYILFSTKANDTEIVFAPTDVGIPQGKNVTREIGPSGGTLSSPDGRITVNIPPNAVPGTVNFSIQPITNMTEDGLGNAYRLEPNGQKFSSPVELLFEYNDGELGDTAPEGLLAVYQDAKGAWRSLRTVYIDTERKTFIASTTHFTDIGFKKLNDPNYGKHKPNAEHPAYNDRTFLKRFRVLPEKATIHIGESLPIDITGCEKGHVDDRLGDLLFGNKQRCYFINLLGWYGNVEISFSVEGNYGYVSPNYLTEHTVYSGSSDARVVRVFCDAKFIPADKGTVEVGQGERLRYGDDFYARLGVTEITILDWGYKVTGTAGSDTVFSGVICDREKPFTIKTNNAFLGEFAFTPSSSTAGTWKFATKNGVAGGGGGKYTIEGIGRDPTIKVITKDYNPPLPKIIMTGDSTGCIPGGCRSGGGTVQLILTPLTTADGGCSE